MNRSGASTEVSRATQRLLWGGIVICWPLDAYAQRIPEIVLVLAVMPLLAAILALVLGIITKSWPVGGGHFGLVGVWIALFVAAAKYSQSDLVNWAPIGALGVHMLVMIGLIAVHRGDSRKDA